MPTPTPITRLPGLKKALGEFADGEMVAQKTLASLYGVAPSRFSTLVKTRFEDFPPGERRGDKTHWYDGRKAVQSMIAYMEHSSASKRASADRATTIMGGVVDAQAEAVEQAAAAPPALSAAEIDRLAAAQTRMWRLAREQGLYVLAEDVRANARRANSLFVTAVTGIRSRIDPNGQLPPEMSKRLDQVLRQIVLDTHDRMKEMMGADERNDDAPRRGSRTS